MSERAVSKTSKPAPEIESLHQLLERDTASLIEEAWEARRRHFPYRIDFAAPSAKRYDTAHFRNRSHAFVDISITGTTCALRCEHCDGRLLETMQPATTPQELLRLGKALHEKGCQGVLVSGGASIGGEVPLQRFGEALGELKRIGLRVIVHCGLIDRATACSLKEAGVDQVLLDIIGDSETIREIYHLDKRPEDYRRALETLREVGLSLAPHVVIGLHRGEVRGEFEAIRHIAAVGVDRLVLVVLSPLPRAPLADVSPPVLAEIARVIAVARIQNPLTLISLGCARPAGVSKVDLERLAVDAGVNAVAYPAEQTVDYAQKRGLEVRFHELCCSLNESSLPQ